jgi:hypothetical protein
MRMNAQQMMNGFVRYKALQFARQRYRSAGRRHPNMSQQREDARKFYDHPYVVEWARAACAEFKPNAPRKRG